MVSWLQGVVLFQGVDICKCTKGVLVNFQGFGIERGSYLDTAAIIMTVHDTVVQILCENNISMAYCL